MNARSLVLPLAALVSVVSLSALTVHAQIAPAGSQCPTHDCIAHRIDTQAACTEEVKGPQGEPAGWHTGLSTEIDRKNYGGNVVAYQIQWSNGAWSGWYVKGVNDIDGKVNPRTNTARRQWSYFADHTHKVLICR